MAYLLTQMLLSLVCAIVFGGALGWLANRMRAGQQVKELTRVIDHRDQQIRQVNADLANLQEEYDELSRHTREEIEELSTATEQIPVLEQTLEKSQQMVRQLMQKHGTQVHELELERDALKARLDKARGESGELERLHATLDRERERRLALTRQIGAPQTPPAGSGLDARLSGAEQPVPAAAKLADESRTPESAGSIRPANVVTLKPPQAELDLEPVDETSNQVDAGPPPVSDQDSAQPLTDDRPDDRVAANEADRPSGEAPLFGPVPRHDDLQKIMGIGPVTEQSLNSLGITSYSQLAELEQHDIQKIAEALDMGPDTIEGLDWVGLARQQLESVLEEL